MSPKFIHNSYIDLETLTMNLIETSDFDSSFIGAFQKVT